MQYVKNRPGADGEKGLWVAALLANNPDLSSTEIAEMTEVSRQYVNKLKRNFHAF
jgi:DNA-binding IscR family transcriptional regulator